MTPGDVRRGRVRERERSGLRDRSDRHPGSNAASEDFGRSLQNEPGEASPSLTGKIIFSAKIFGEGSKTGFFDRLPKIRPRPGQWIPRQDLVCFARLRPRPESRPTGVASGEPAGSVIGNPHSLHQPWNRALCPGRFTKPLSANNPPPTPRVIPNGFSPPRVRARSSLNSEKMPDGSGRWANLLLSRQKRAGDGAVRSLR